jgi:hypothetical protein
MNEREYSNSDIAIFEDRQKRLVSDLDILQREFKDVREIVKAMGSVLDVIKENIDSFSDTVKKLSDWKLVEDTLKNQDRKNIDILTNKNEDVLAELSRRKDIIRDMLQSIKTIEDKIKNLKCLEQTEKIAKIEKFIEPLQDKTNKTKDIVWKLFYEVLKFALIGGIGYLIAKFAT